MEARTNVMRPLSGTSSAAAAAAAALWPAAVHRAMCRALVLSPTTSSSRLLQRTHYHRQGGQDGWRRHPLVGKVPLLPLSSSAFAGGSAGPDQEVGNAQDHGTLWVFPSVYHAALLCTRSLGVFCACVLGTIKKSDQPSRHLRYNHTETLIYYCCTCMHYEYESSKQLSKNRTVFVLAQLLYVL